MTVKTLALRCTSCGAAALRGARRPAGRKPRRKALDAEAARDEERSSA